MLAKKQVCNVVVVVVMIDDFNNNRFVVSDGITTHVVL
jgi:hypothetical protein